MAWGHPGGPVQSQASLKHGGQRQDSQWQRDVM